MKLLLDTHIFLWWDSEPDKLSPTAKALCEDSANVLLLSLASVWEMQIKHQSGKLTLRLPLPTLINNQQETNGLEILPIRLEHLYHLSHLPLHHRDPFDRLLIAQAQLENTAIVTADSVFPMYGVQTLA